MKKYINACTYIAVPENELKNEACNERLIEKILDSYSLDIITFYPLLTKEALFTIDRAEMSLFKNFCDKIEQLKSKNIPETDALKGMILSTEISKQQELLKSIKEKMFDTGEICRDYIYISLESSSLDKIDQGIVELDSFINLLDEKNMIIEKGDCDISKEEIIKNLPSTYNISKKIEKIKNMTI